MALVIKRMVRNMTRPPAADPVVEVPAPTPAVVDTDAIVAAVVEQMSSQVLPAMADAMAARFATMVPRQDTSELEARITEQMQEMAADFRIAIANATQPRTRKVTAVRDDTSRITGFTVEG